MAAELSFRVRSSTVPGRQLAPDPTSGGRQRRRRSSQLSAQSSDMILSRRNSSSLIRRLSSIVVTSDSYRRASYDDRFATKEEEDEEEEVEERQLSPDDVLGAVNYTRTGRVSKAKKGRRVHVCEACGKVGTILTLNLKELACCLHFSHVCAAFWSPRLFSGSDGNG